MALILIAVLPCHGPEARANISGMGEVSGSGAGGLVTMRSDSSVSLLRAKVELDMYFHHTWGRVSYELLNTGPATELILGYPAFQVHDLAGKPDRPMVRYQLKADGVPLEAEIRKGPTLSFESVLREFFPRLAREGRRIALFDWVFGAYSKSGASYSLRYSLRERLWTPRYYVSRVTFPAGGRRRLEIVFLDRNLIASTGSHKKDWHYYLGWHVASLTYLATPARTWKGPIGRAEFRLRLPSAPSAEVKVPTLVHPPPQATRGQVLTWTFTNWKPEENFHVALPAPIPEADYHTAQNYAGKLRRKEVASFLETVGSVLRRGDLASISAPGLGTLDAAALSELVEGNGSRLFRVKLAAAERATKIRFRLAKPRCLTRVVTVADHTLVPSSLEIDGQRQEMLEPEDLKYLPLDEWTESQPVGDPAAPRCKPTWGYYGGRRIQLCEWLYAMVVKAAPLSKPIRAREITLSLATTRMDREMPISAVTFVVDDGACPVVQPAASTPGRGARTPSPANPEMTRGGKGQSAKPHGCGCASDASSPGSLGIIVVLLALVSGWSRMRRRSVHKERRPDLPLCR